MAHKQKEKRKNKVVEVMKYLSYWKQFRCSEHFKWPKVAGVPFWGQLEKRKLEILK